jgi:DNA mismatch repair protein MutS
MEIKRRHADAVLFYRMGDFYEMFFDDAVLASRVLGIALTSRDREKKVPMCGVPYHAARSYISRLLKEGHKVALCEQTEDPALAKGLVERAVERVITPGVALDAEFLDNKSNNFIAAAISTVNSAAFAYMDVLTGEFRVAELSGTDELAGEIKRVLPTELLVEEGKAPDAARLVKNVTPISPYDFSLDTATERLKEHFEVATLDGFGLGPMKLGARAAGALLGFVSSTQGARLGHIRGLTPYYPASYMVIDHTTMRNLDILENSRDASKDNTLLSVLDRTRTAMGARTLRAWLARPLKDPVGISARLDAVEEMTLFDRERREVQDLLDEIQDMERLMGRISMRVATPRDMVSLRDSLRIIPRLIQTLHAFESNIIAGKRTTLDPVTEAMERIERTLVDAPPLSLADGGVIREGFSTELDDLRSAGAGAKDAIAGIEATERERTGIASLKVGYNRVYGYYMEVSKAKAAGLPPDFIRKQTLVNAERFATPELKDLEAKILGAEERARALETAYFMELRDEVAAFSSRVLATAKRVGNLDAYASLADAAKIGRYARPVVSDGDAIRITDGRHPVIEAMHGEPFVPNDLCLDASSGQIHVITGPNMAGKSTFLRQAALITLMAQIGSFVPAASAEIGVVDRIFSRVGAADDISRGQSTFMVEMSETANILNNATPRSLVILDEIGRGTSTFDGLSIAWAVVERLHDNAASRARTLFATHYHELTDLSLTKERVKNYNMAVREWDGKIVFLRKVVPGGSSRSYGIQVAKLAGLPDAVTRRAAEILKNLERGELNDAGKPRIAACAAGPDAGAELHLVARSEREERFTSLISAFDIDSTSPKEALDILYRLKETLDD